jgi:hypothetical protein
MNKVLSWLIATVLILATGCATVSMQYNLMEAVKTYEFSESADVVYAGAQEFFKGEKLELAAAGDKIGVTPWKVDYVSQGSLSHTEKVRYKVTVSAIDGNKSIIRIFKESIPDKSDVVNVGEMLGGEILTPDTMRDVPIEYQVLKHINPAVATQMEADAAK